MDRKLYLQEFLMEKLKYNTKWHPTILCQQAQRASVRGLFTFDNNRHDLIVERLLKGTEMSLDRTLQLYKNNMYKYTDKWYVHRTQDTACTHYLLGEEFTYWAQQRMPLLILDATGDKNSTIRIVTKCLPSKLPIEPVKSYPKEFIVSYLLGDQDAVFNFLTNKISNQ